MTNQFGMFIHWGIYAQTGIQEQVFAREDWDRARYEQLAQTFCPSDYDPEAWVLLAKRAGMKYICFTAKHHDGFCMWDTRQTDYSVMHTPYGKDVLKQLSDACRKHGMKLSIYYSIPDWHHPFGYNPASTHQWKAVACEHPKPELYRDYIRRQMTELLTGYGEIHSLFWDIPPGLTDPSVNQLVRKLQPGILINDRGFDKGDFSTPEREYQSADGTRFTRMTEACNSVGVQSWGYRADEDFYAIRHLLSSIDRIMAMGGSYLLNVGPDAHGVITEPYASRVRAVGDWYCRMEGCLENAGTDSFDYRVRLDKPPLATEKNGKTYLHFPDGICSSALYLRQWRSTPERIRLMNTGDVLPWRIEPLPEFHNGTTGRAETAYLRIHGIPIDRLSGEPIVLEVEWKCDNSAC